MCDGLTADIDKRVCTLSDQESSAVARMLAPSYAQLHDAFQDERIEATVDFGDRENDFFAIGTGFRGWTYGNGERAEPVSQKRLLQGR